MKTKIPDWTIYALGSVLIILLGIYMTSGIMNFMDIQLSDETKYMTGGIHFFERVPKGWGPSYSAWYKLLHFVEQDPIKLHYLNFKVLAIGVSVLLFNLMYRIKVPALLAFFGGACFLFADINIETWPRISHFAAAVFLTTILISTFLKSTYLKLLLFTLTALFISYARPEIGLSFTIMMLLTAAYVLYKRFRLSRADWIATIAVLPVVAVLFLKLGIPMLQSKGQPDLAAGNYPRSVTAYGQHFYLNYTEWAKTDDQILFLWDTLFKEYYAIHPSLVKTLMSNIPITIKHVSVNVWNYSRKSFDYVSGVFLPDKILYLPAWLKLLIVLGLIGVITWMTGWKNYRQNVAGHVKNYTPEYILIFVLAIPSIISCVLIYPREHYIMLQIPLFFMIATALFLVHSKGEFNRPRAAFGMIILAAILFALMPKGAKFDHFAVWQDRTGPVNLSAIKTINEIGYAEPYTIILNEGNIDPYLDNPDVFSLVGYAQLEGIPFAQAVDSFNVRMVYMTSLMDSDPWYKQDSTWVSFLNNPASLNFEKVELATPYSYLLVDKSILPGGQ